MPEQRTPDEKVWLVKKNQAIQGPFSDTEIKQGLKTGIFSPIDSACLPGMEVWLCISNYQNFKEFIKTLDKDSTKENLGKESPSNPTGLSTMADTVLSSTNKFYRNVKLGFSKLTEPNSDSSKNKKSASKNQLKTQIIMAIVLLAVVGLFFILL